MARIKIIIDGEEWNPSGEEKKAVKIEMWYDRHIKLWTLYPVDEEGNQLAGATYEHGKKYAQARKKEMETEYGIR